MLVNEILEGLASSVGFQVLLHDDHGTVHELVVLVGTVRSHQHVGQRPELTLLSERLDGEHIKDSACDCAILQGRGEVSLVDSGPTTNVHKHSTGLHLAEAALSREEFDSMFSLGEDAHDVVSLSIDAVELVKADELIAVSLVLL